MRKSMLAAIIVFSLLLMACDDNTGPSEVELTPSVLSLQFTGDTLINDCEITVSWTMCPESEFKSYILYRSETAGIEADSSVAEVLGVFSNQNTVEYVDSGVSWDNEFFYVLKTVDDNDEGVWSNEDSLTN